MKCIFLLLVLCSYLSTTAGSPVRNWYFSPSIKTILNLAWLQDVLIQSTSAGWWVEYILKDFLDETSILKKSVKHFSCKTTALSFCRTIFPRMQSWVELKIQNARMNWTGWNSIWSSMKKINNRIIQKFPKLVCHKTNFVCQSDFWRWEGNIFICFFFTSNYIRLWQLTARTETQRQSLSSQKYFTWLNISHMQRYLQMQRPWTW